LGHPACSKIDVVPDGCRQDAGKIGSGRRDELLAVRPYARIPMADPGALRRHDALRDHVLAYSVKRGDFTLKSGAKSSWFLDTKQTACRPDGITLVAEAALEVIPAEATAIGGLTMGADPLAFGIAAIAAIRGRNLRSFSIRKEAKDHGVQGRMAGALQAGDKVVVTEDTATRGTSALEAVHVIRALGAEVVMILALVDRGGTAGALAAAEGIAFAALLDAPDLGFPFGS
jgi:orotate phosphoribosyltransferase